MTVIALLAYGGTRAIHQFLPGGDRNLVSQALDEGTRASEESGRSVANYRQTLLDSGFLNQHPQYAAAIKTYQKELDDFTRAMAGYKGESWSNYRNLIKEYREANQAYNSMLSIYQGIM